MKLHPKMGPCSRKIHLNPTHPGKRSFPYRCCNSRNVLGPGGSLTEEAAHSGELAHVNPTRRMALFHKARYGQSKPDSQSMR